MGKIWISLATMEAQCMVLYSFLPSMVILQELTTAVRHDIHNNLH